MSFNTVIWSLGLLQNKYIFISSKINLTLNIQTLVYVAGK